MSAASGFCTRTDIHEGCKKQRQCSTRSGSCHGLCSGFPLNKKGTRMLRSCAACSARDARVNPAKSAATSQRKRAITLAAAASDPSLRGLTLLSDPQLHLLAAACLRRPDVARLFAEGSPEYVYCFQWTAADEAGFAAPAASLSACERKESLSHVFSGYPPLWYRDGAGRERKIVPGDIFHAGSGAYIIRLVISPFLCDVAEVEKTIHEVTDVDEVGFKGHVKVGGSPAQQRRFVYGCSLLVIPGLDKLHLVVNESYRESYEAELEEFGGREGRVELPAAPPASFVLPPREASRAFVLGGPRFEYRRSLITAEQARERGVTASQEASQGEAEEDDASVASWGGGFGECIYFSGKTAETGGLSAAQMEAMGGEACFFTGPPTQDDAAGRVGILQLAQGAQVHVRLGEQHPHHHF
jgi:hypothetical protein